MNRTTLIVFLALSASLRGEVGVHTFAESNQVLKVMLNRLAQNAADDTWPQESKSAESTICIRTLRDFFMGGQPAGWTYDECQGVFDGYLSCLATNCVEKLKPRERFLAKLALKQCDMLQYSNAVPQYMTLALNTNTVCRERAIKLAVKFSGVSENATRFVETIFTNEVVYGDVERETAAGIYASMVQSIDDQGGTGEPSVWGAVEMFYRNRLIGSVSCYSIDSLLCARLPGYTLSSNRLETVKHVLSMNDIDGDTRRDFTVITNQLLSSGQPLRQLTIGEGGDE